MRTRTIHIAIALLMAVGAIVSASVAESAPRAAYFEVGFRGSKDTFVIQLRERNKIQELRAALRSGATRSVMGRVVKRRAAYNSRWRFYLKPASISLFDYAVEVCDASPRYVQRNLAQVGGALLPGARWCPWHSYIRRELKEAAIR